MISISERWKNSPLSFQFFINHWTILQFICGLQNAAISSRKLQCEILGKNSPKEWVAIKISQKKDTKLKRRWFSFTKLRRIHSNWSCSLCTEASLSLFLLGASIEFNGLSISANLQLNFHLCCSHWACTKQIMD